MNKYKNYLLILGTFSPLTTLASGIGDSLDWLGIHIFVILAFFVFLILAELNLLGKLVMILIFIAAEYLSGELTIGLPYSDNKLMLQILSVTIPAFTTIASYWILRAIFKTK